MRRNGWHNQWMISPFFEELTSIGQAHFVAFRVRRGKFEYRLTTDRAHSSLSSGGSNFGLVIIHVREHSHTRPDHLLAPQHSSQAAKFRVFKFLFWWNYIGHSPYVQAQIIRYTPNIAHTDN